MQSPTGMLAYCATVCSIGPHLAQPAQILQTHSPQSASVRGRRNGVSQGGQNIWLGSMYNLTSRCVAMDFFLYAVQVCFQENGTINKDCFKHIAVIDLFQTHHGGSWGVTYPPNPRTSLIRARSLQVSSRQLKQNPYGPSPKPW